MDGFVDYENKSGATKPTVVSRNVLNEGKKRVERWWFELRFGHSTEWVLFRNADTKTALV